MSYTHKARALTAGLVVLAIWPCGHSMLVKRYDINAWKFAGWAMYSRLGPQALVTLRGTHEGQVAEIDERALPQSVQAAAAAFHRQTRHYGLLANPDKLAALLLREFPSLTEVAIQREGPFLDPHVDRVLVRRTIFRYTRDGERTMLDGVVGVAPLPRHSP